MKNHIKSIVLLLGISILSGCVNIFKLADLRDGHVEYPNDIAKAKQLMKEMGIAHGIQKWDAIPSYKVIYTENFYGLLGKQGNPFKEQDMKFELNYIPKTYNGQLEILSGKEKGTVWGIQSGTTYKKEANGNIVLKKDKDMAFVIPTYQYFIELPNRIQEATAIDYVGKKMINGVEAEGIIASWNTFEPQKDLDQYIIWLDAKSKRIIKVDYTIRDIYRFVSGTAYYNNYKDYNGLILPSEMPVESNLVKEGYLHKMSILEFAPHQVKQKALMPLEE